MTQEETKTDESFDSQYFNFLNSKCDNNFVVSPFSIITALSICGIGSDNNTLKQFCSLFGIKDDLLSFYKSIIKYNNEYKSE